MRRQERLSSWPPASSASSALWEAMVRLGRLDATLAPAPTTILEALIRLGRQTRGGDEPGGDGGEVIAAFLVAVPVGLFIGFTLAEVPFLGALLRPLVNFLFGVPKSIFLPIFILVFGVSIPQKIAFGVFTTVFVMIMGGIAAVQSVPRELVTVSRVYGAGRLQIVREIYVPAMAPILLESISARHGVQHHRRASSVRSTAPGTASAIASPRGARTSRCRSSTPPSPSVAAAAVAVNEGLRLLESAALLVAAEDVTRAQVAIRGVSQRFGVDGASVTALDGIDLDVPDSQFVSVVGPSGCGKSTLLSLVAGLRQPSSGSVLCDGELITAPMPRKVGMIFQEANLLPWLSAIDNVAFPSSCAACRRPERLEAAARMLELTGLAGFESRLPHQLSGGMKQRVAIARGLVQNPAVLLMDEPFASLDEQTRMVLGDELLRIWSETRKTVLFVTHSLHEAVYLADRVIVLSARPGRIVDDVPVEPAPSAHLRHDLHRGLRRLERPHLAAHPSRGARDDSEVSG